MLDHADLLAPQRGVLGRRGQRAVLAGQPPDLALEPALALAVQDQPDGVRDPAQRDRPQPPGEVAQAEAVAGLERLERAVAGIGEQLCDLAAGELGGRETGESSEGGVGGDDAARGNPDHPPIEGIQQVRPLPGSDQGTQRSNSGGIGFHPDPLRQQLTQE